jgi:hypothetical protein
MAIPADENHLRCAICGFIVDTSFDATTPTIDFTMAGRAKKSAPSLASIEACARVADKVADEPCDQANKVANWCAGRRYGAQAVASAIRSMAIRAPTSPVTPADKT